MANEENKKQYSKQIIDKLKSSVKIEEIIGLDYSIKKIGKNYFMKCFSCDENSLTVSPHKQFAHCFSCNMTLDVFGYYQKTRKISFLQSVNEVKKIINSNNVYEFQKLLKAATCFNCLTQQNNPFNGNKLNSIVLNSESSKVFIKNIDDILTFLVSDYKTLNHYQKLSKTEITKYKQWIGELLNDGCFEKDNNTNTRFINLFNYILDLLKKIEENDFNMGGLVYFST